VHTVELLFDPVLEASVRDLWDRLHAAGLPSLATHRHPTNRPHVTLTAAASLAGLPVLALPAPVTVLPGVRMLGRALVREIAAAPALRTTHAAVWRAIGGENPLYAPETWTPHVSLALKVPEDKRSAAVALLAGLPSVTGQFVAARSYDTETRTVTPR
jgi:hypothetical protein